MYTFLKSAALEYLERVRSGLGRPDVVLQKRPQFVDLHDVGLDLPFQPLELSPERVVPNPSVKGRALRAACVGERGLRQRNPDSRGRTLWPNRTRCRIRARESALWVGREGNSTLFEEPPGRFAKRVQFHLPPWKVSPLGR